MSFTALAHGRDAAQDRVPQPFIIEAVLHLERRGRLDSPDATRTVDTAARRCRAALLRWLLERYHPAAVNRRAFVAGLGAVLAAPVGTQAQPAVPPSGRPWRVGILFQVESGRGPYLEAILEGFRQLGYVEGRDLTIALRSAAGDLARLPDLAHELVRLPVDVIMTSGTPGVRAAMAATTTIPIVMLGSTLPVQRGFVQSVARPGGNVTGIAMVFDAGRMAKQLQLLKEAAPKASRVGILTFTLRLPGEPVRVAARQLGLTVFNVHLDAAAQLESALSTVTRERADALYVDSTGPNILRRHEIADFALRHQLPLVADTKDVAEAGGLLAYAPDLHDVFRRAPSYVDRILKGTKPGELPVQQADRWDLVINMKTAKALGLTIPPSLLLRADQVID
jgi:putative tryptophan/tyrosine transport system substrate-binding protein